MSELESAAQIAGAIAIGGSVLYAVTSWLFAGEPTLLARMRGKANRLTYEQWKRYSKDASHPLDQRVNGGYDKFTKFVRNISYPMHRLVTIGMPQATEDEFNKTLRRGSYHTW